MDTMKRKTLPRLSLTQLLLLIIGIALVPLIISVFRSGYTYIFDNDELYHSQLAFLYATGFRPYLDIYNSVYPPLFGWFLDIFFKISGFTIAGLYSARYAMIVLFGIRVVASFAIVRKLFSKRIAILFTPMFLLDPFVIFSSMQIRPDNLMMTIYTIGLFLFAMGFLDSSNVLIAGSALLSVSVLILPKVVPGVALLFLAAFLYYGIQKKFSRIGGMIAGALAPVLLFSMYCIANGSFWEMLTQTVFEAKAAYSAFSVQIPLGNFYIPGNIYVYGMMGRPVHWFFVWFLPYAACGGVVLTVIGFLKSARPDRQRIMRFVLACTLLVQWASLFFLPCVFMQHYIPISWLYAVFTAVTIDAILTELSVYRFGTTIAKILLTFCCLVLISVSIKANTNRSKMDSAWLITYITNRWATIPPNTYTFPNFLFRPTIHPITYGYFYGNVPLVIRNRLPSVIDRIKVHDVKTLLVDGYLMSKLPEDIQAYITNNYSRVPGDDELMVKK